MSYHEQPRFTMSYHDNPRFTMSYHESGATVTHAVRTESQARLVVRHGSHPMQSMSDQVRLDELPGSDMVTHGVRISRQDGW